MSGINRAYTLSGLGIVLYGTMLATNLAGAVEVSRSGANAEGHAWTLGQLTRLLAGVPHRKAHFEETHYSSILKEPLKTEGKLTFTAPSKVEKHVLKPFEERYLVNGDMVMVEKQAKGTVRTISLEDYPTLRAFVEGYRAVLVGDWEILRQFYDLRLEGEQNGWVLRLIPLEEILRERVQVIRFVGKKDLITSIEIWESNGDHSKMVITRREK